MKITYYGVRTDNGSWVGSKEEFYVKLNQALEQSEQLNRKLVVSNFKSHQNYKFLVGTHTFVKKGGITNEK